MRSWREVQEQSRQAAEAVRREWLDELIEAGLSCTEAAVVVGVRPSTLHIEATKHGKTFPSARGGSELRSLRAARLEQRYQNRLRDRAAAAVFEGEADITMTKGLAEKGTINRRFPRFQNSPNVKKSLTKVQYENFRIYVEKGYSKADALRGIGKAQIEVNNEDQ